MSASSHCRACALDTAAGKASARSERGMKNATPARISPKRTRAVSTLTSQPDPRETGTGRQHSDTDALLPATMPGSQFSDERAKVLFVVTTCLLKNTYSPDVVKLALYAARSKADTMGFDPEVTDEVLKAIADYWNGNRMFAGMF